MHPAECPPGTKGLLDSGDAMWLTQNYFLRPEDATDPRFAVIRADHKALPSATVITCEVDPLRDEGKAYAEKLKVYFLRKAMLAVPWPHTHRQKGRFQGWSMLRLNVTGHLTFEYRLQYVQRNALLDGME